MPNCVNDMPDFRLFLSCLAFSLLAAVTLLSGEAPGSPDNDPGFSVWRMDRSVDPGNDFYRFANGTWEDTTPIPADRSRWGAFDELRQLNDERVLALLEETAALGTAPAGSPAALVRDFFRSGMDRERIDALGLEPLQPLLSEVDAVNSIEAWAGLLGRLLRQGQAVAFGFWSGPDAADSSVVTAYLSQGGLGLPTRDHYFEARHADTLAAYRDHIVALLVLSGLTSREARSETAVILEIETALAGHSLRPVELRDREALYNPHPAGELPALAPDFPWAAWKETAGLSAVDTFVVRQPGFFAGLAELIRERPLEDWKTFTRWRLLRSAAPYLGGAFEAESFAFNQATLQGTPEPRPAGQRVADVLDDRIGEAVGALYVERHYGEDTRRRMEALVDNVLAAFGERLRATGWMSSETRDEALRKFEAFTVKIGHPENFRDYAGLEIRPDDWLGNIHRAAAWDFERRRQKIGGPVDRAEWWMTPQTVNAYYGSSNNEIVFPAAILQPPFFDPRLDDAVNYGAIGAIIGHEISHGFDDQGRLVDAEGNLRNWWSEQSAEAFAARAQVLAEQVSRLEAAPGLLLDGELTLGESIADLCGLAVAFEAWRRSRSAEADPAETIDGFTGEQRFFLSWAQAWRTVYRPEALREQVVRGPHPPGQFRATIAPRNHPAFFRAFAITPEAPLHLPESERAVIW
ncbi:MAG: M13 family peptidase [Puniceicoccaceae bacterium]|nr:MAG: M13 family peptidase [Puniceicoccaceae bacterium]